MEWKRAEIALDRFSKTAGLSLDTLELNIDRIRSLKRCGKWEEAKKEEVAADRSAQQILSVLQQVLTIQGDLQEEDQPRFIDEIRPLKIRIGKVLHELKLECQNSDQGKRSNQMWLLEEEERSKNQTATSSSFYAPQREQEDLRDYRDRVVANARAHQQLAQDIEEIEQLMRSMEEIVHCQQDTVDSIENNVENARDHMKAGERDLKKSVKYATASYPLAGAAVGAAAAGGPVGVLIGLKVAVVAGIGGAIAGGFGGKYWKKKTQETSDD